MDEDDVYGPEPESMTDILEDSDYILHVSPHERALIMKHEHNEVYQVFCTGIPPNVFEDKIVRLFDKGLDNTVEIRLAMNPATDKPKGHALIVFKQKEDAERAIQELNKYEIASGTKLTVGLTGATVDFAKATNFPFEGNNIHICIKSSSTNYCTCIKQMIADISSLVKDIRKKEQSSCKEKVEEAREINKLQYACHSLLMESIDPIPENMTKILDASQYAVEHIDNISEDYILNIHKRLEPEGGMFRTTEIFIFGIYGGRRSCLIPQPPAPDLVLPEMKKVVELMKSSLSTDDEEAVILRAMTVSIDFVMTHPFYDGNGRCSRVLFNSILKRHEFPWITIPVTYSTRYYEALASLRDTKNYTLIYRFLCRCIERSIKLYFQNLQS